MMSDARRGFSLMEILLATSILVGSSIVLVELATIGRKQANHAHELNMAQLLCQAKVDEIIAGVEPLKAVEQQELEDEPGWLYSVELEPRRRDHLVAVKVSVFQEERQYHRSQRFTLVRWLPDNSSDAPIGSVIDRSSSPAGLPQRTQRREDRL